MISAWWLLPAVIAGAIGGILGLNWFAAWRMQQVSHTMSTGESRIIETIERLQGKEHDKRLVVDSDSDC